jgi:hypothetical protein
VARQITESLKRFGVAADATALLVARFDGTHEEVCADMRRCVLCGCLRDGTHIVTGTPPNLQFDQVCALIQGTRVPLSCLDQVTDAAAVQKAFKPTAQELGCGTLHDAVVCRLATKDVS